MSKMKSINAYSIAVPLETPYKTSNTQITSFQNVFVEIQTEDGLTGIGEADYRSVGQEAAPLVAVIIQNKIAKEILGMDVFDLRLIMDKVRDMVRNIFSLETEATVYAAIDLALWDLQGKILKRPVYQLLGGCITDKMPVSYTLSIQSPEMMAKDAVKWVEMGYKTIVVKAGREGNDTDLARVRQVRKAVGDEVNIRVDLNGIFRCIDEAVNFINSLEPYNIEFVEQPLIRGDVEAMRKVRERVSIPVSADESLVSLEDAFMLAKHRAVDIFNIKPPKCGGIDISRKIAVVAEAAGIKCILGGHPQHEFSRQASRSLVAALPVLNYGYAHEGPGPASQSLVEHITEKFISYDDVSRLNGFIEIPGGYGLDAKLREGVVRKYLTWPLK